MPRSLISCTLAELTELHNNSKDRNELELILDELSFRSTRGAKRLAAVIQAQLDESDKLSSTNATSIRDTDGHPPWPQRPGGANGSAGNGNFIPISPEYPLTDEQIDAVDSFKKDKSLKVTAFAGTGKTSTLVAMAGQTPRRGLYLAFNKSIANEAKEEFPPSTDCRTTHSVAFRSVNASGSYTSQKLFNKIGPKQLAEELQLTEKAIQSKVLLTGTQQAYMLLGAIRQYCQSEDDQLGINHVRESGRLLGLDKVVKKGVKEWVLAEATKVWEMMIDPAHVMPMGHDGYLKLWSNSNPALEHDYILLDEAQDTNPAVIKVLRNQATQLILVGDSHQQIYSWRGAVDAMEQFDTDSHSYLTQSFRFGEALASAASKVLRQLGEKNQLHGNNNKVTMLMSEGSPDAILTRTNSSVIEEILGAIENKLKPYIVGGNKEALQLTRAVYSLMDGTPAAHPDFFGFNNWAEVVEYAESEEGEDIRSFVSLVQQRGIGNIYRALRSCEDDESSADIVVSTAHKSKGRQWSSVKIAYDFGSVKTETGELPEEEIRLFYVAITRAKDTLIIPDALLHAYQVGNTSSLK